MEVKASIDLPAPPERVFDLLLDLERLEEWVSAHEELVEPPGGALAEGSTFRQKLRVAGVSFTVGWEVTALQRPRLVEWRGEGPGGSDARVRYSLQRHGQGTRFDYLNEFRFPGGLLARKAAGAIGGRRAQREAERSLESLKALLA